MPSSITYYWGKDNLTVHLAGRDGRRVRALQAFEVLVTVMLGSGLLLYSMITTFPAAVRYSIIAVGLATYVFGVMRYLSRRSFREYLLLDNQTIGVLQKSLFTKRFRRYYWTQMGPLRYCGGEGKTDHPLKGQRFDYWGFDTHEKLVQDLHREGAIGFSYGDKDIRFGKGLYLWHAEELADMLRLYAGSHLRFGHGWSSMSQVDGTS